MEMLQDYLASVVESIVGSLSQCPPVMRVTFKQLHKRVEERFTQPENEVSPRVKRTLCNAVVTAAAAALTFRSNFAVGRM